MRPGELYEQAKALEIYFDGNPDAWLTADVYGPWLPQLRAMGVRETVQLNAREADDLGYVLHRQRVAGTSAGSPDSIRPRASTAWSTR